MTSEQAILHRQGASEREREREREREKQVCESKIYLGHQLTQISF